ncbi:DUF4179 domain-containing protein [Geosporobacter ferrireducens]|uniref:DUF4179 domain-containing protein n=1 Tax=Geosporobacter ferrireducens TaxID=1424294 RepID=A0A1D8GKJ5_9FIRM|nr:DUF4179 domain-containing protein [Geosporobacter ferrireducens]AOT71446.1 hypothetical protein Gferi_19075 [Geosporobacter ferrireducens]
MNDTNNIYEFLNEMDFDINDYEKQDLTDIEKKHLKNIIKNNLKNNKAKKYKIKQFGGIAAALVLTIGIFSQTSFGREVYASTQSMISEISYSIGRALGVERDVEIYSNVVNKVIEDKGVEVKLTDVIIDKDELIICTVVNTNRPVEGVRLDYNIFINGKKIRVWGGTGSCGKVDDSKTIFTQIDYIVVKDIDTKESLDIKIAFNELNYFTTQNDNIVEGKVKGKWIFEFTADGSELMKDTHVLPLDYSFQIANQTYSLEAFRYNPVNQKIEGSVEGEFKSFYQIDLRGYDNLGNEINFYLSRKSNEDLVFKYENFYKDFSDEITSITLTPYAAKLPEESGRMSNDYEQVGETFTIFLNK